MAPKVRKNLPAAIHPTVDDVVPPKLASRDIAWKQPFVAVRYWPEALLCSA